MSVIKARVGSQNVIRVLSNASSPPASLISLDDINTDLKNLDGMILVWDLPSQNFIMTNVIDSTNFYTKGINYFENTQDSSSISNGSLVVGGGVGIGKNLNVGSQLNVVGSAQLQSNLDVSGNVNILKELDLTESATFRNNFNLTGLSTFSSDVDINASVDISNNLSVHKISNFYDTTDNVIGNPNTGALQVDGGVGINKNLTVGGKFYVEGSSQFIGTATFRGGTINIGDGNTDDVNVGGEFISNLNPNTDATYSLGTQNKRWKDARFSGLVTTTNLYVSGVSEFKNNLDIIGDLFVTGFTSVTNGLYYDLNDYDGPNGIAYFDNSGKLISAASTQSSIQTSYYILTTEEISGVPVWTSVIDGGVF